MKKNLDYGSKDPKVIPSITHMNISSNPRANHADITHQPHLFGDVFGDADLYGDAGEEFGDNLYGDPNINESTIALYKIISGDIEDGDPVNKARMKNIALKAGLITAGGAATALGIKRLREMYLRKKNAKKAVSNKMGFYKKNQTLYNQRRAQANTGRIAKNQLMPFFQLMGAKLNGSQIEPLSAFPADMLKNLLDRQNLDTPFLQETAIGVFAAGTWTATAVGAATARYYGPLILSIGINELNAAPGTVFNVTVSMPLFNGTTLTTTTPFTMTIEKGYDVRFLLHPWQLVSNKPLPVLGSYSAASNIVVTVTGLPSASSVNLVVPGSLHPWIAGLRNAIV